MKILYIKLKNFAGINAGMGLNEIEIDFRKNTNGSTIDPSEIVMLFGGNGSGKSTILSTLHPFRNTGNDSRKDPITIDKEGYKEIHYNKDDKFYVIQHFYYIKSANKSFIRELTKEEYEVYRNTADSTIGEELNENGGLRLFDELIEEHLGLNSEYFKISRIGSNVTNFIDLKPAERKKFISMFLPDIDEYLEAYDIINTKHRSMQKDINYILDEIQKHDTEENLLISIESYDNNLETTNKIIEDIIADKSSRLAKISMLDSDGNLNKGVNPLAADIETYKSNMDEKYNLMRSVFNEFKKEDLYQVEPSLEGIDMSELPTKIDLVINDKEHEVKSFIKEYNSTKESIGEYKNKIATITKKINSETSIDMSLKDIDLDLVEINDHMDDLVTTNNNLPSIPTHIKELDYTKVFEYSNDLKNLVDRLVEVKSKLTISELDFFKDSYMNPKSVTNKIMDVSSILEELNIEITKNKEELDYLRSNIKQAKILEKRPSECSIDSCAFIKNALEFSNIDIDIERLTKILADLNKDLEIQENNLNLFKKFKDIHETLSTLYNRFQPTLKVFPTYDFIKNLSDFTILIEKSDQDLYDLFNIDHISTYKRNNLELQELSIKREKLLSYKKDIENSNLRLDAYRKDIDKHQEEYTRLKILLEPMDGKLYRLEKDIDKLKKFKDQILSLTTNRDIYNEYKTLYEKKIKEYEDYEEKIHQIKTYNNEILDLDTRLNDLRVNRNKLEKDRNDIIYKLKSLKEYQERQKKLEEEFHKITLIKEALHPNKGIPVYFIDNYLNDTRDIANDLLNISQEGNFAIDFDVDSRNFFIKVYKQNGDILDDITTASQGEMAITSLSLSLALIEQSMSDHNILYLDELDGALDTMNRRSFIEMVETQMEKLDIEQVFIISHNNEFDYYPLDLILLRDNDFNIDNDDIMSNKNILFKYNK